MIQFNIDPEAPDNVLGENPPYDDWFHNPLDDMPIATDNPRPEKRLLMFMHQGMNQLLTLKRVLKR